MRCLVFPTRPIRLIKELEQREEGLKRIGSWSTPVAAFAPVCKDALIPDQPHGICEPPNDFLQLKSIRFGFYGLETKKAPVFPQCLLDGSAFKAYQMAL